MQPLVGITGRRMPAVRAFPEDAVLVEELRIDVHFTSYGEVIRRVGGIPVQLAYEADVELLTDRLDAVVLSGGPDVDPRLYGARPEDGVGVDPERDTFELGLVRAAVARGLPIIGVCRGLQLLNVARGGSLVPDLPIDIETPHFDSARHVTWDAHDVVTVPGTRTHAVYGPRLRVNSSHRQAIDLPGDGVVVSAAAEDGTIEAIEIEGHDAIGVQWHAEWQREPDPLWAWLIDRARTRRA
jgi:putative glutamine amidotransferase